MIKIITTKGLELITQVPRKVQYTAALQRTELNYVKENFHLLLE